MTEQIRALEAMKSMAAKYGYDIGRPARNAQKLCSGCILPTLRPSRRTMEQP